MAIISSLSCRITNTLQQRLPKILPTSIKKLHTTNRTCALFYEKDPKGGYNTTVDHNKSKVKMVREGLKELRGEIALWSNEMQEKFQMDPIVLFRPGETDIAWQFGTTESLEKWVTTSDKDHNEGYSSCSLTLNQHGKAVFAGELNNRVPKDGRVKRAGYCNMKSIRSRKSFKRETYLDWTSYNMLVMRVRGDGRSYMLNISTTGYYDVLWNDVFHFILFTRGGPYWQMVKIPFSKFFLSSKGRIQDQQCAISLNKVTNFGITAADKVNGLFQLEIDYIGLEFDPNNTEEFAYEMYKTDKYIAAN